MKVVIVGGGIVGVSCAYFLAKRGIASTIVEQDLIAGAASGKAGGFLAKDWCRSSKMNQLARRGFELHMELMQQCEIQCGYRKVDVFSIDASEDGSRQSNLDFGWVDGRVSIEGQIGTKQTCAQVHPYKLVNHLFQLAKEMTNDGTRLVRASAVGFNLDDSNRRVKSIELLDPETKASIDPIEADCVVLATGPWTGKFLAKIQSDLSPDGFEGTRVHSLVLQPKASNVGPTCLFVEYRTKTGSSRSPEIYPRPDGTVYICGMGDNVMTMCVISPLTHSISYLDLFQSMPQFQQPLPDSSSEIEPSSSHCDQLSQMAASLSSSLSGADRIACQACYLPLSPDGLPIIGRLPTITDDDCLTNVWLATGHSCWGILTGPVTGRLLAAMVAGEDSSNEESRAGTELIKSLASLYDPKRLVKSSTGSGRSRQTTKKQK